MSNTGRHRVLPAEGDGDDHRFSVQVRWLLAALTVAVLAALAFGGYEVSSFLDSPPGNPAYSSANPAPSANMTAPPVPTDPGPAPPVTYTVQKGDTLWSVAVKKCGKGTDDAALYRANMKAIGSHPGAISPGMTLRVSC